MKPLSKFSVIGFLGGLLLGACASPGDLPPTPDARNAVPHRGDVRLAFLGKAPSPFDPDVLLRPVLEGSCRLPSGLVVRWKKPTVTSSDMVLWVGDGERSVRIEPSPRLGFREMAGTGESPVRCDQHLDRIYYADPLLGFLIAWRSDGVELWRIDLRKHGFRRRDIEEYRSTDPVEITRALYDGELSVITNLVVDARGRLLVESKPNRFSVRQLLVHRSGHVLGGVGPWDGFVVDPAPDGGWILYSGGVGAHGDLLVPTESWRLDVESSGIDAAVEHFVAWYLPDRFDDAFKYRQCAAQPPGVIERWLGEGYDEKLAVTTRRVHDRLGPAWIQAQLDYAPFNRTIIEFDPHADAWRQRFQRTLIEAGADVVVRSALLDHDEQMTTAEGSASNSR